MDVYILRKKLTRPLRHSLTLLLWIYCWRLFSITY